MEAPRYCPLCDRERPEAICAVHEVPTLPPATGQPPPITKGSVIVDRYRVQGVLSHGGMGTVLDATQVGFNRPVVVKVLRGAKADDRGRVRRFYVEARLVSTLDHPHIVRVFEFGVDPVFRVPFIAMERVDGVTLQDVIDEEGPLTEIRTAKVFEQIVRALMEAHDKGVLHRDLKPRNVMVRRLPEGEEHVTVLDFGLAKLLEEDASQPPLTAPGRTVGTPGFMSPEQVLGRKLDFRSDLYGVGCMMYNVLAGRPPFDGPAALGVMRRQVREPPPALPRVLEGGQPPSAAMSRLLFALLEKNPDDRPARIEAVRDELTQIARGEPDGPATVLTLPARPAELPTVKTDSQEALRRSLSESDQVRTEPVEIARSNPSGPDDDEDGLATVQLPPGALDRLKTQPVPSLSSNRPAAAVSSAQPARVRRVWTAVGIAALLAAAALLATVLA
jgi:serine/threonine protein kinase